MYLCAGIYYTLLLLLVRLSYYTWWFTIDAVTCALRYLRTWNILYARIVKMKTTPKPGGVERQTSVTHVFFSLRSPIKDFLCIFPNRRQWQPSQKKARRSRDFLLPPLSPPSPHLVEQSYDPRDLLPSYCITLVKTDSRLLTSEASNKLAASFIDSTICLPRRVPLL